MATILKFRPFRLTNIVESEFITSTSPVNREYAEWDLACSGLTMEDIGAATSPMMKLKEGALAGYTIPYFGLDGEPITDGKGNLVMYRERFKYPEFSREQRYRQPQGDVLAKFNLSPTLPYFHPLSFSNPGDEAVCCEGEKKTVAVLKYLGIPAFGIGGCHMWRSPDKSGAVHPWILTYLRQRNISKVQIVPDGDVFRYDICNAYGTFARALEAAGLKVRIVNPRGKIDDLIVGWGNTAPVGFGALEEIPINDLVQSPDSLVSKFGLAFKSGPEGRPIVYPNSSNITKILEGHRAAFPEIWRNTDTNTLMFGEDGARPGLTEMEVTNYFQHNLGFHTVKTNLVMECMSAQAKKHERSPFLDYIKAQVWDGVARLDKWMIKHWGIEDTAYTREVSARWLLASCARLSNPGCEVHFMLIVVGPQGTGKTSMPRILFNGNALVLYGEQNDKDLHMLLHSALCVGFDELDSVSKREASNMKAMITRATDTFRPPYAASNEVFPRRFVLYGSGNRYEFLQSDPSGYRRYAILEAKRLLDFKGLEADRDQLWAEAWHRFNGGEVYWEITGASAHAEQYAAPDPIKDQVIGWIETERYKKQSTLIKDGILYFTMTHLLTGLSIDGKESRNPQLTRELAAIVRNIPGMEYTNSRKSPVPGVSGRHYKIKVEE
jgi:hypothetical protein